MVTSGITTIPIRRSETDSTSSKKLLGVLRTRVQRLNGIMTSRFEAKIEDERIIDMTETITIPLIFVPLLDTSDSLGFGVGII